jgi:hypothetical protein
VSHSNFNIGKIKELLINPNLSLGFKQEKFKHLRLLVEFFICLDLLIAETNISSSEERIFRRNRLKKACIVGGDYSFSVVHEQTL